MRPRRRPELPLPLAQHRLPLALLLAPLARHALAASPDRAGARFTAGMLAGAAIVALVVLWERAAFPGLFDWASPYRATALFWEMHLGGAAIDGYLALAVPFVAGALWGARTPWRWAGLALLAALVMHAVLATFSRGLYLAAAGALALQGALGGLRWYERRTGGPGLPDWAPVPRWRTRANAALIALLAIECAAALHGTFLRERVADAAVDLDSRAGHWRRGIGLLHSPADWLFGLGTGRLPAHYLRQGRGGGDDRGFEAGTGPARDFGARSGTDAASRETATAVHAEESPGAIDWVDVAPGHRALRLSGPERSPRLGGRYALAQRVVPRPGVWRAELMLRARHEADLLLLVCERHLLYSRHCRGALVHVQPGLGGWQRVPALLRNLTRQPVPAAERAPRPGLFTLAVTTPGAAVEVAQVMLRDPQGGLPLANDDFADGAARWFPVAQGYFVPWHVDSLALELLIERGVPSLVAFAVLAALALHRLTAPRRHRCGLAPIAAASIAGALLVGCVSSLLDMPRVAFLLLTMVLVAAWGWERRETAAPRPATVVS